MYILWPLLIGLIIGITVYGIINASNNNPKVIKVLTLIGLIIAIILGLFMLFLLLRIVI